MLRSRAKPSFFLPDHPKKVRAPSGSFWETLPEPRLHTPAQSMVACPALKQNKTKQNGGPLNPGLQERRRSCPPPACSLGTAARQPLPARGPLEARGLRPARPVTGPLPPRRSPCAPVGPPRLPPTDIPNRGQRVARRLWPEPGWPHSRQSTEPPEGTVPAGCREDGPRPALPQAPSNTCH